MSNRAQYRRAEREKKTPVPIAPLNIANFTMEQISQTTGVRIESLKMYLDAREKEIREAVIKEAQEKLFKAEDYICVANILTSVLAIKESWNFTKANQKFIDNYNHATAYLEKHGVKKVYEELHEVTGIELEFDDMDLNKEFGFDK